MRIKLDNLEQIVKTYKRFLINKRINDIVLVNSRLFLFKFKKEKEKLVVDLDNNNPHIGLVATDYDELTLPSEFIAKALAKGAPLITDIELVNNDKVVRITTQATDAYYHQNKYYLYIELINAHANMILTNQNKQIIVAFYETSLEAPRPIIKNIKYVLPTKKNELDTSNPFSLKDYQTYVNQSFIESLNKRKKELYGPQIKKYEKRLKNLERKLIKIKNSEINANDILKYKEYGETILMNIDQIKRGDTTFNNIKLDTSKDAATNANIYFNKYKKAKRTIETIKTIIADIEEEILDTQYYLDVFKIGNEEEIKTLFVPAIRKKQVHDTPSYLPSYVTYQNVNYYFGHNALANDYLTFKMFKKSSLVTWLHLKDQPSPHLIINKNKPTNQELDLACSLLLLLSKVNAGEIMYAKRADITRDNALAKVNVLRYQSIYMRKVNAKALELLSKKKRVYE